MPRKKTAKKNTGAKAKAKDRSTAVSQNVKVNIGSGKTGLRNRFSRPSYTMPSFGGGGSAHVNVTVPHPLPSFDQQAGYSIHQLSSNVDNLVRFLQQQGAQPVPGPSSEALARTAVMGTQTEPSESGSPPTLPRGASEDLRNLDMFANMPAPPVTRAAKSEGGTQTDPLPDIKPENVSKPPSNDAGTDPIVFPSSTRSKRTQTSLHTSEMGTDPMGPGTNTMGTQTSMLGQSVATNTDPLHFNVGDRSRNLPPRPQRMDIDMSRAPTSYPTERGASKRKSNSTHEGMLGDVGRPEFPNVRAEAPNGLGPRPPRAHPFEGLAGRYPFVYQRPYRFDAQEGAPMGGFNFADNERPRAKRKRDDDAPQGGVQKMQRVGRRPRRNEGHILRDENALRAAGLR